MEEGRRRTMRDRNEIQIDYFSSHIKKTMIPRTTPYISRHVKKLIEFSGIKPGDKVLEVGCGMGRYTFTIAERGIDVEGLDLTEFLLDRFREYDGGRYNIPVYCTDIAEPPSELYNRYDAVLGFF